MRLRNVNKKKEYQFFKLTFPVEVELDDVIDFLASAASSLPTPGFTARGELPMVLELWSDKTGLTHRLGIPWEHTELLSHLRTHISGIHIEEHSREVIPEWTAVVEVGVSNSTLPFSVERVEAQVKRLMSAHIADMKPDDVLVTQWVLSPATYVKRPPHARQLEGHTWIGDALLRGVQADPDQIKAQRAKAVQTQFRAVLRVGAYASTDAHAQKLVANIKDAFQVARTAHVYFTKRTARASKVIERLNRAAGLVVYPGQLSAIELAAFSAWPIGSLVMPGLSQGRTRYLPPNEAINRDGRRLGLASAGGYEKRPIAVSYQDALTHTYVIGASGRGKTVFLGNNLQQDIEKGYGAVVLESKGDLFYRALDSVPRERLDDVVVIDLTDYEYPVGFNILQEGDERVIIDDLMRLFMHNAGNDIYLREMLFHGFHTLRTDPRLTVIDLLPFLKPRNPGEEVWRDFLIDSLPHSSELYHYWKAFKALKPTEQLQKIRPVENRIWQLTNRRDIRNMLGQSESTINLRDIMEQNKLLFVYIPESIGDETVSLLGSLIVSNVWDAVRAVKKTKPTFMYMDEVQRFLNLPIDLNDMLSLARSYGLGLTMAHQYTAQLPRELFEAVTNASTKVAFALDGPDAARVQKLFGDTVTPQDFINLDRFEVMARVGTHGSSSQPVTIKALPAFDGHGLGDQVRARSRAKYARKAETVDAELVARRVAPSKPKRTRPSFGDRELSGDDE